MCRALGMHPLCWAQWLTWDTRDAWAARVYRDFRFRKSHTLAVLSWLPVTLHTACPLVRTGGV